MPIDKPKSMPPREPHMIAGEDDLLADIEAAEEADPNAFYQAKLASVKVGRELGLTDAQLEAALGIKLKPEDRNPAEKGKS